ncbi:MAG: TldD/PmbA family protein [Chloroflexi bacterium]|nr:TldD/PmbA family protein [Chloroflexota bacterium]
MDVLQLAKRVAEEAEVYLVRSIDTPISFESNRLKMSQTKETRGMALRIIKRGRLGFSATTDLRNPQALVDDAASVADLGAEAKFHFPPSAVLREVQVYDPLVAGLAPEAMIAMGQEVIAKIHAYDPEILCDVGISKHVEEVQIYNSNGGSAAYQKTVMGGSIHGNLVRGTDMLDVYEERVRCQLALAYDDLARELIRKFELAKTIAPVSTKPMPVVFTPKGAAGALIGPLEVALSGKTVLQGASPLGDKLGKEVFDRRVSLFDDGTIDFAPHSSVCDDEGVPTRRKALVENGVLFSFYYDLQTAGLAGKESTGNGFRGLYSLPGPALSSVLFAEGEATLDEMVGDVKEGILVDQTMGAWAGNVLSGDFSANVHLGYKIENGQIVGRVKNTMVAGNVHEAFKNALLSIGSEAVWVGGSLRIPPLYFGSLSVSSKG